MMLLNVTVQYDTRPDNALPIRDAALPYLTLPSHHYMTLCSTATVHDSTRSYIILHHQCITQFHKTILHQCYALATKSYITNALPHAKSRNPDCTTLYRCATLLYIASHNLYITGTKLYLAAQHLTNALSDNTAQYITLPEPGNTKHS